MVSAVPLLARQVDVQRGDLPQVRFHLPLAVELPPHLAEEETSGEKVVSFGLGKQVDRRGKSTCLVFEGDLH